MTILGIGGRARPDSGRASRLVLVLALVLAGLSVLPAASRGDPPAGAPPEAAAAAPAAPAVIAPAGTAPGSDAPASTAPGTEASPPAAPPVQAEAAPPAAEAAPPADPPAAAAGGTDTATESPASPTAADAADEAGDTPAAEATEEAPAEGSPPREGVYHLAVIGDSLADGIWGGIYRHLRRDDRIEVLRRTRNASGLARPDFYDWFAAIDRHIASDHIDAAVVVFGLNDTQPLFHEGRWEHAFGTPTWDRLYRERVAAFMDRLRQAGIETFWIGLPVVRSSTQSTQARHLNDIYRTEAEAHGIHFIPTWELASDARGRYSSYLPDSAGRSRLMRHSDGVHFTSLGYNILTNRLLEEMARHLTILRTDVAHE